METIDRNDSEEQGEEQGEEQEEEEEEEEEQAIEASGGYASADFASAIAQVLTTGVDMKQTCDRYWVEKIATVVATFFPREEDFADNEEITILPAVEAVIKAMCRDSEKTLLAVGGRRTWQFCGHKSPPINSEK